jgi:hypothetical protein
VVADTKERRTTPRDVALPVFFVREQFRTEGFEPCHRHTYFITNVLFIHLSLLCFKARVTDPVLEKRGILARVHEASYRFLFFRLLSAKMGTKIVRVSTFSIYNP